MQSFRFIIQWNLLHFSKAFYKRKQYTRKSQIQLSTLAGSNSAVKKHTNTSVKGKHKHHSMSTSRNTGTNHKGKTVQTVNFVTIFHLFSQSWDIHRTPSTIITNVWACFLQFRYSGFAGCPWDTERVAAFLPPQISYPSWALQSNTERNLPSTFSVFSHIF